MKLVGIASVLAVPIAYFWMSSWLESFAYSTGVNGFVFVFAAGMALLIGLGTVSFQSIKAAIANPVKSLRDE